jgi:hypothetical protein
MSEGKFPPDWDEKKVLRVLAHYEEQTEEDAWRRMKQRFSLPKP